MVLVSGDVAPIITSISALVAACGSSLALIMGIWNSRRIKEIHVATNGMKAELVKVTGEAKFAEGVKQGEDHPREGAEPSVVKVDIVKLPDMPKP